MGNGGGTNVAALPSLTNLSRLAIVPIGGVATTVQEARLRIGSNLDPVANRLAELLRRDLKLGADMELTLDTALFGGELDLDSLDALLLVQSIEREFGIRVPTEAIGPAVFATLGTLAEFVLQRRA
jgi:acyl carrier protein